ncbi:AAA family ATPase [Gordonia sp. SND2]|uniref:AAA family ATPase n=1 Tax=Gordonia sp. SND2 TaxID=3388659 RepID=UPI00398AEB60
MTAVNGAADVALVREHDRATRVLSFSDGDREQYIQARVTELALKDEAARRYEEMTTASVAADIGSRWRTSTELKLQPSADKLLGRILWKNSLVLLAGDPGTYKSFLALDWALCVRTGRNWSSNTRGKVHTTGQVVYLAGEGDAGIPKRITAWEKTHNDGADAGIEVFPSAVGLRARSAEAAALVEDIAAREPVLVVIDTLARYSIGLEENSVRDMSEFIAIADRIREQTGACVLIVHHNARGTGRERGSTSIRGAMDGLFILEKITDKDAAARGVYRVELTLDRLKDESSGGDPIAVELSTVDLGVDPDDGMPITSLARTRGTDPFSVPLVVEPLAVPTVESSVYTKLLWEIYLYAPSDNDGLGYTRSELRAHAVASPLAGKTNLGKKWSKFWADAIEKNHLIKPDPDKDTRAYIDTTLVENELGWTREEANAALRDRGEQVDG